MVDKERVRMLRAKPYEWTYQQIADDQHCTPQRVEQILKGRAQTSAQAKRNVQLHRQRRIVGSILLSERLGKPLLTSQLDRLRREAALDPVFAERHKELLDREW